MPTETTYIASPEVRETYRHLANDQVGVTNFIAERILKYSEQLRTATPAQDAELRKAIVNETVDLLLDLEHLGGFYLPKNNNRRVFVLADHLKDFALKKSTNDPIIQEIIAARIEGRLTGAERLGVRLPIHESQVVLQDVVVLLTPQVTITMPLRAKR